MDLEEIRKKIDAIDDDIIDLLATRAKMVRAAGKLKKDREGVRDPRRVEEVIAKIKTKAREARLDPAIAEEIYRTIIGCFVRSELDDFASWMAASTSAQDLDQENRRR